MSPGDDGVKHIVGKDAHFKLFWFGNDKGTGGVGVLLAEKGCEKVFEVVQVSDRIILFRMTIGKTVLVYMCVQANLGEFDRFYQTLQCKAATIPASEQLIVCGDWHRNIDPSPLGSRRRMAGMP